MAGKHKNYQMGKPTHPSRMLTHDPDNAKNKVPAWYAGGNFVRIKPGSKTGGKNNSGTGNKSKGKTAGREKKIEARRSIMPRKFKKYLPKK